MSLEPFPSRTHPCFVPVIHDQLTSGGKRAGSELVVGTFFLSCFKVVYLGVPFSFLKWFLPYTDMNQPWIYMCSPSWSPLPPPSPSHPTGSSQCTSPEHLSHASNLGWWSVLPLIVYLFQRYSFRTSHPRLLPQSPKICSVHLCLFFCFAYRVIVTIFLLLLLPSF